MNNNQKSDDLSSIEAAGFKKFVKKSISIKIKSNDASNQLSLSPNQQYNTLETSYNQNKMTVLQMQQNSLSNKLKQSAAKLSKSQDSSVNKIQEKLVDNIYDEKQSYPHLSLKYAGENNVSIKHNITGYKNSHEVRSEFEHQNLNESQKMRSNKYYYESQRIPISNDFQSSYLGNNQHNNQFISNYNCSVNDISTISSYYTPQLQIISQNFNQSHFKFNNGNKNFIRNADENYIGITDDNAYDIDEEDQIHLYKKDNNNGSDIDYDLNYDLECEENLDEIIVSENNEPRYKLKKSKHKHHHTRRRKKKTFSLNYSSNEIEDEYEESLENMKLNLKKLLNNQIDLLEHDSDNIDRDLLITLKNLLEQINDDDGSLNYDECLSIKLMVENLAQSIIESDTGHNSKKKNSKKIKQKEKKRNSDISLMNEIETGEINDGLYDDDQEQVVKKEYDFLLNK
jgi:hypothetical protein